MGLSKIAKKRLKAQVKLIKAGQLSDSLSARREKASLALRFAEAVRGVSYMITSVSLVLAVVLQERGVWLQLSDVVEDLMVMRLGQLVLIVIALALFIYGLKHVRLVK